MRTSWPTSETNENKNKNKWDLKAFAQQTKPKTEQKDNPQMGKNICKRSKWQGINFQNIQTAHVAQYQKKKKPQITQSKMGGDIYISPKKTYRWPRNTWKDAQHH